VAIINNYYNEMLLFYNGGVGFYSADLSTIKNSANNAKSNNRVDNIFTNRAFNQNNYNVVLGYVLEINSTLSSLNESAPLIYDSLIGYYNNINRSLDEINANKDYNAFNSHIKNDIKNNLTAIVNFVDYCTNFNNDLKNCYNNALKDLLRYNNYNTVKIKVEEVSKLLPKRFKSQVIRVYLTNKDKDKIKAAQNALNNYTIKYKGYTQLHKSEQNTNIGQDIVNRFGIEDALLFNINKDDNNNKGPKLGKKRDAEKGYNDFHEQLSKKKK
jgi:hypothetical protein